jgi:hypothetical protein
MQHIFGSNSREVASGVIEMKWCEELSSQFIINFNKHLYSRIDEMSDFCILTLPFKDSMGDYFIIRVKNDKETFVIDDGGTNSKYSFHA